MRIFIFILLLLTACEKYETAADKSDARATEILDKAIEAVGGERFEKVVIEFDFRDYHYKIDLNKGLFSYHRMKSDSAVLVEDVLNNQGFQRYINDEPVNVVDTMAGKYASSVNSVIYFALLPYGLNSSAVIKEYIGETEIEGQEYHKIKVTFEQEGGGEDHEDIYFYWINKNDFGMDYLAYEFYVEGGGKRFRKAINPRVVNGIKFQDYDNYKPSDVTVSLEKCDSVFINGGMEKVSQILIKNVEVEYR